MNAGAVGSPNAQCYPLAQPLNLYKSITYTRHTRHTELAPVACLRILWRF